MERILKPEIKIAASPALIEKGCVALIGLEDIREAAAGRWEKTRPSVYAHLDSLLRQKLGPADFYAQIDDLTFLVTMPSASNDEAMILCLRVANDLHTSLLGKCDINRLRVARASSMGGDVLTCEPATGARLTQLAAIALSLPMDGAAAPCLEGLSPLDAAVNDNALLYTPIWDVQNEVITTYRCESANDRPFGDVSSRAQFKSELNALLARIRAATMTLSTRLAAGERYLLSLPIPYELFSSPVARMEVTGICRNLSSALRPYLQFEISELPYGVPQSRLSELVGSLRPFCRGVWGHVQPRIASFAAFQGAGLQGIGLSVGAGLVYAGETEADIAKMCATAKRVNLRTFVHQIPDFDMLDAARELKVNMLSGGLIGDPVDEPGPIMRLPAREILIKAARLGQLGAVDIRNAG